MSFLARRDHSLSWRVRTGVISLIAVAACLAGNARAQSTAPPAILLTNLQQVVTLSDDAVRLGNYHAKVQGVITYIPPARNRIYFQDGPNAIYADCDQTVTNQAGELIELTGPLKRGFLLPRILPAEIRSLGMRDLPEPKRAEVTRLVAGEDAMKFVLVHGTVRDVIVLEGPYLMLLVSEKGVSYRIHLPIATNAPLPRDWLDSEIEARGMCRPISDNYGNAFGFVLYQNSTNLIRVLRPGTPDLFARPLLSIRDALQTTNEGQRRLKITGSVLAHIPGKTLFLQDATGVVRVNLLSPLPKTIDETQYLEHEIQSQLQPGEQVEVIAARTEGSSIVPSLADGEFRRAGKSSSPAPLPVSINQLEAGEHPGRLVTLKARLLDQRASNFANAWYQWLVLEADGHVFQARWESDTPATWNLKPDEFVQVTGVNDVESGDLKKARAFHLVLRSPADVMVTTPPPFWARTEVQQVALVGAIIALLASGWIAYERRQVRRLRAADEMAKRSEVVTSTINYFATSLLEQHTEDDILWDLAKNCISQLGFMDCVVYLLDRERGVLVQKAALGAKNPSGRIIANPIVLPLGKGIVGSVAASGKAALVGDTSLDARYVVDDQQRFSEITVPIVADGEVIGVIDSEHSQRNFFTPEHLKMLTAIASLCANKLVRARAESKLVQSHQDLEQRITERTRDLLAANQQLTREVADRTRAEKVQRALFAISEAIHSVQDLPSLCPRIHEIVGTLMPAGNFYIGLQDAVTQVVSFPYWRDELEPATPPPRQHGRGLTEYVLRVGRAMLITGEENQRLIASGECVQQGAISKIWLGVPLSTGGRPFGVMVVQDHHSAQVYGEEEKSILGFVAEQIALAIERKRAESDLRTALAAEKELNELKSSFVSMVSHEFRTPLGVILSSSNILDRYLQRLPPDKRAAQLRAIRKSVHRMNDLIDDVLVLGKFDAGALCCQPVPLDLPAFCRRAVKEIESATARDGAVHFQCDDTNGDACADEGLLQHILTNIIGNAVKYSPPEQPVEFTLVRQGADAEFIVRDRGCGIPAADQPRLFTAFYRGSNVGRTSGSGLGLVIAKRCVDLHGGTILCESAEGIGTTFTIKLPLFDGTRIFRRRQTSDDRFAEVNIQQTSNL